MGVGVVRLTLALALSWNAPAFAGFNSWSAESESDPFSGGTKVTVDYATSIRSGVFIVCDTAQHGMLVRAVPGFSYEEVLAGIKPVMQFAVDGKHLVDQEGSTGAVGDNLAAAQVQLTHENALTLVNAFVKAKKQIALKDGISDRPFLLRASGSSKSGAQLAKCLKEQVVIAPQADFSEEISDVDVLTDAGRHVQFKAMALAAQDKCPDYKLKPEALEAKGIDAEELATVERNMLEGQRSDASKDFEAKSCFAALRAPLPYAKLSFDEVWEKK